MQVKITKVPAGPAPLWVREAWVGVEFRAQDANSGGPEVDFLKEGGRRPGGGGEIPTRDHVEVFVEEALNALETRSPDAAQWFRDNLPPGMPALSFGCDDIEILG